ncbi:MAG: acyl-homoserine-lactone synthase [Pseudomonadota bacterium]
MYQIIQPKDRAKNLATIDSMHRNRYDVCVTQWGWNIPGIRPGYDKDQFDTEKTVYITITDPEFGKVVASTRMNPTTEPHMMSELFAHYCTLQPYPQRQDTWECSRYVIDRTLYNDPLKEFKIRCSLGVGIAQYCVEHGINQVSWLTHQKFYQRIQKAWATEPLGLPVQDTPDGWAWVPAVSQVNAATYARQRERLANAEDVVAEMLRAHSRRKTSRAA